HGRQPRAEARRLSRGLRRAVNEHPPVVCQGRRGERVIAGHAVDIGQVRYYIRLTGGSVASDFVAHVMLEQAMSEIWQLPAGDLAQRIAGRQLSSVEVVDAHLARIDAVNPALNAVVRVLADEARADAALADKKLAAGETVGPLHGVPFTVKENIDMAGLPTTWGVPALAQAVVPADAPVVERMRGAGAIPIGRTNLPDMALRVHTHSSLHGLTRNPWHPGRTPGGGTDPKVAATVRRAAQALADAGYVVEEACPPRYEDAVSCWARLIMGDFASVLGMLAPMMGVDATAFVNNFNETVPPLAEVA